MPLSRRDLQALLVLPQIIKHGSLNRAAQRLNTSQPALTRQIKALERSIGAPIFHRSIHGITLTAIGDLLVAYAEATAVELQQVSSQVASLATRKTAPVRLGITIQSRDFFIDTVVASYLKDDPSSCVQIVEDTRTVVMEQLRLGRIDVVLAPSYEVREPLLVEKSLMEIESGVLAGKHHPLGRKRNLKLKDLMHSKWILPLPDGRFYRWIAEEFRNKGLDFPLPSVQTSSLWSVKSLLKKTDLISVHGIQFMQHELSSGELQVLKGDWSFRRGTLSLFMHNRAEQSSGAVHFATLMEQHAEVLRRRS